MYILHFPSAPAQYQRIPKNAPFLATPYAVCVCENKRFDFTDHPDKKCDEQDCQATRAQAKVVPVWPIGEQVY